MTLRELLAYTAKWRDQLGLSQWEIEVKWMCAADSRSMPDANGYCWWSEQHQYAEIRIAKDSTDIEHTVIHELLHLRLEGHAVMADTDVHRTPIEVCINRLADQLRRMEKRDKLYETAVCRLTKGKKVGK
jgi:Zn-dependent peptidase ImmA (M78 family)